ncbi:MAG: DUF4423 domain-containing protein [Myxococcales bacterium]|nr:DUF4423 domain-containing protein [Myxococcales bacterium]
MDYERISAELLRKLRGSRSQEAFARRVGVRANAIYTWEAGRNFPSASRALTAASRAGVDVVAALERFYGRELSWLGEAEPTSAEGVARLLQDLRGKSSILDLSRRSGQSRFTISRWLKGQAEPRLPDLLCLIEAASLRLLDFLACFVDPRELPSIAEAYRSLEATRAAAYESPWSQAFLRALELSSYRALPGHEAGWLAEKLGLSAEEEIRCLSLLERSGQIVRLATGHFTPAEVKAVDTRRDPEAARRLRLFWAKTANERLDQAAPEHGVVAYNLFGVSLADLQRLEELQRAYFREMRAIIAESEPAETVVIATMQMVRLLT